MDDLFDGYAWDTAWDEMFDAPGQPRRPSAGLHATLSSLTSADLEERCAERDRSFHDRGVTFSLSGEERPFPLDPIPRVISAEEWSTIEVGVSQRLRALEALLADLYGDGQVLADGLLPRQVITSSEHFHRAAWGVVPPNGVRIQVAGIDLVRDRAGRFCVLEDNVRIPSGVSYVIENRRTMTRVFPELVTSHRIQPVTDYPSHLLAALNAAAPARTGRPTVVVLTPGVYNSAYFEHSFLARQMGVELVEGRDLFCRSNELFMRTTSGEERVDVVYRRVDDEFLDPVQFNPASLLGCPGITNAARAGNVTIANAIGNGVADDKLIYTYVPELIEYYLGEHPVLPNVTTYRLEDPEQLEAALARLDELVLKPVAGSGGAGLVIGPQASDEELASIATEVRANPRGFIAQEVVTLSTAPTRVGGRLEPRHIDLRPFVINDGESVWVLPGGLTRVALQRGSLIVNSSRGGGSKDTWVLAAELLPDQPCSEGSTAQAQSARAGARGAASDPASRGDGRAPGQAGDSAGAGPRTRTLPQRTAATTAAAGRRPSVLSRIAEALFWMGRYLERADDTARILDVELHQMLEDPGSNEMLSASALLSVMGLVLADDTEFDLAQVSASLAFDRSQPSSIVASLIGARENASTIRETISSELWECLNGTYVALDQRAATARAIGPHAFFGFARFVRERVAIATGIAEGTMPRDDTWQFLVLGRSVERADMTARLLSVRLSLPAHTADWVTTLRCCSAHEAYLRTYRAAVDATRVTEFLLLDRLFPRSAYHALATAEQCCTSLEGDGRFLGGNRAGPAPGASRLGPAGEAQRILGRARADLEYRRISDHFEELPELLQGLQTACSQASAAVASRFFHRESSQVWHKEGSQSSRPITAVPS